MICDRCHGCLIRELVRPTRHTTQTGPQPSSWLWRCYNCGDRTDRTILRNRAVHDAALVQQREAFERDLKEWALWLARGPIQFVR